MLQSAQTSRINSAPHTLAMKTAMLKKITFGLGLCITAAAALSQPASDIRADPDGSAYMQSGNGVIVRGGSGMCWRTGFWTPSAAVPGCDGPLVPPIAKPTAPEVIPPPPVALERPAPPPQKRCDFSVTLGDEQFFRFNGTALSRIAKKRLEAEVLPQFENCKTVENVLVTGHTDRIGSHLYNQKLSEKRAEAVANYLKSRGITAPINTLGAGKTRPVSSCSSKLPRAELIKCMAPDRRVVIEARGIAR